MKNQFSIGTGLMVIAVIIMFGVIVSGVNEDYVLIAIIPAVIGFSMQMFVFGYEMGTRN